MTDTMPESRYAADFEARAARFEEEVSIENLDPVTQGSISKRITGPVSDWATDFTHAEPEYAQNAPAVWKQIRESVSIARTERFGGGWFPSTYADVSAVAYDTDHFSSRSPIPSNDRPPLNIAPIGDVPPISADPPFHHDARKLLLPAFTKTKVADLEPAVRGYCHELIDALEGKDVIDAAYEYAQYIPMWVIGHMLGYPNDDMDKFRHYVEHALEGINDDREKRNEQLRDLFDYVEQQVLDHEANPREDLTDYLMNAEIFGMKLDGNMIVGASVLLLVAGIDTTWSAIGASLWHMAQHPEDRDRWVNDPEVRGRAVEEFLRFYAPVTMGRLVKEDYEFQGKQFKAEDWVFLSFPSANRDPEKFEDADKFVIDRAVNNHAAFGLGIHRCVGSHLARQELRIALDVWMERFPDFSLESEDTDDVRWSLGQVRGPRTLPVRINKRS